MLVKKLRIQGCITASIDAASSTVNYDRSVRVILVLDKQTNGVQLNAEDVMAATATGSAQSAYQSLDTLGRFKVLKDKFFVLPNGSTGNDAATTMSTGGGRKTFKWSVRWRKGLIVRFNATNGGTVADIVDNSFHIIASYNSLSTGATVMTYNCRVVYTDV